MKSRLTCLHLSLSSPILSLLRDASSMAERSRLRWVGIVAVSGQEGSRAHRSSSPKQPAPTFARPSPLLPLALALVPSSRPPPSALVYLGDPLR